MSNEKTAEQMSADAFASWQQRKIEEQEQRAFIVRDLPHTLADIQERLRRLEQAQHLQDSITQGDVLSGASAREFLRTREEMERQPGKLPRDGRGLLWAIENVTLQAETLNVFTQSQALGYASEYRARGANGGDPAMHQLRADILDILVNAYCDKLDAIQSLNKTDEQ